MTGLDSGQREELGISEVRRSRWADTRAGEVEAYQVPVAAMTALLAAAKAEGAAEAEVRLAEEERQVRVLEETNRRVTQFARDAEARLDEARAEVIALCDTAEEDMDHGADHYHEPVVTVAALRAALTPPATERRGWTINDRPVEVIDGRLVEPGHTLCVHHVGLTPGLWCGGCQDALTRQATEDPK